jgi:hypothetical protein
MAGMIISPNSYSLTHENGEASITITKINDMVSVTSSDNEGVLVTVAFLFSELERVVELLKKDNSEDLKTLVNAK